MVVLVVLEGVMLRHALVRVNYKVSDTIWPGLGGLSAGGTVRGTHSCVLHARTYRSSSSRRVPLVVGTASLVNRVPNGGPPSFQRWTGRTSLTLKRGVGRTFSCSSRTVVATTITRARYQPAHHEFRSCGITTLLLSIHAKHDATKS